MEALTSLSSKIFSRTTTTTLSPSYSYLPPLGRSQIRFSSSPIFKGLCFDHFPSVRSITKRHVVSDAVAAEVIGLETQVPGLPKIQTSKTAHVKFQLEKECMFGDQLMLVGDDPMLGLWNPTNAIPMNWSDGHIWNVELDIPIESTIQFKFILKQSTGEMLWQPGPDRIFKSWESKGTLVIAEDWEDPEAQKITEEQMNNPDFEPIVAGNTGNTAYAGEKLSSEVLSRESSSSNRTLLPDIMPPSDVY